MAQRKRKIWTVCYILYRPQDMDDPDKWYSSSWMAFGRDEAEAKADFLKYFERERENFFCGDDPSWEIHIDHAYPGWSC